MEKPIFFNTEMVRAILDGRKTMTRRVIKQSVIDKFVLSEDGSLLGSYTEEEDIYPTIDDCLYQLGDILWVRETWNIGFTESVPCNEKTWTKLQACVPCHRSEECTLMESHPYKYLYKASPETFEDYEMDGWRPSIHMPRAAARLFLKVTNVRVERLQDITEEDARAEGCIDFHDKIGDGKFDDVVEFDLTARDAFAELWNSTVKKQDLDKAGWYANPWAWIIEFERVVKES